MEPEEALKGFEHVIKTYSENYSNWTIAVHRDKLNRKDRELLKKAGGIMRKHDFLGLPRKRWDYDEEE